MDFVAILSFALLLQYYVEIQNAKASGKPFRDNRYVDVYREKQIRVVVKVIVPVKEHPKFNFVGKLLGPRGNSMRRLQEETLCKMAILGRGSMKDRKRVSLHRLKNEIEVKKLCFFAGRRTSSSC